VIRVVIVDDEPLARETAQLVLSCDPDVEVVGACTGVDAVALITSLRPDLVVLDIQMPKVDGFDVVARLGLAAMPEIVFVTAYDQYAIRAFEVHALDYVLKPYDDRRLLAALARAKQRIAVPHPYLQRVVVRGRERSVLVSSHEIDLFEAADDYVEIHVGTAVHIMRVRLSELELRLDPSRFVRVHRSTIVNLERVRELQPLVRGDALIVLHGGAPVRLSRSRRAEFERRLTGSPQQSDSSPQAR